MHRPSDVTALLKAWRGGDQTALERLTPLVYNHLRRLGRQYVRKEHADARADATSLGARSVRATGGCPDSGLAGPRPLFRGLFDDHAANSRRCRPRPGLHEARRPPAKGRGDHSVRRWTRCPPPVRIAPLTSVHSTTPWTHSRKQEPRRAKVIELRYFGGLSVEETAEALGVSAQTVLRDWKLARAWLAVELRKSSHP